MRILRPSEITSWKIPPEQLTPEQLAMALELARAAFTADDLQRYTELEDGIGADLVLQELEDAEKEFDRKSQ